VSEFWAAIAGAVVGSLVGGFISYLLQASALKAPRAERAEVSAQERQAPAYALVFNLIAIVNNLANLKLHVDECKARAAADHHSGPPATFLLPLVNILDPVNFDPATMGNAAIARRRRDVQQRCKHSPDPQQHTASVEYFRGDESRLQ
jgi:hypothetical protein